MNPHSSSSCDVFQVGELWVGTCKSLLHLLSLDFLENYRVWLREQTCLCNVLVAMCLGDVPMLLQQARSFSMLILWKCNVTGLGQEPEPDHPSDLFCCQTGQTNSVEALWTFLIMNNSHFILNAWWVILKYSCWKIRFGAYFLNDLSPLSILWLGFAFKKSFHLVEGKRILFFFFFFVTLPWDFNRWSGSSLRKMIYFMSFPVFVDQIWWLESVSFPSLLALLHILACDLQEILPLETSIMSGIQQALRKCLMPEVCLHLHNTGNSGS